MQFNVYIIYSYDGMIEPNKYIYSNRPANS